MIVEGHHSLKLENLVGIDGAAKTQESVVSTRLRVDRVGSSHCRAKTLGNRVHGNHSRVHVETSNHPELCGRTARGRDVGNSGLAVKVGPGGRGSVGDSDRGDALVGAQQANEGRRSGVNDGVFMGEIAGDKRLQYRTNHLPLVGFVGRDSVEDALRKGRRLVEVLHHGADNLFGVVALKCCGVGEFICVGIADGVDGRPLFLDGLAPLDATLELLHLPLVEALNHHPAFWGAALAGVSVGVPRRRILKATTAACRTVWRARMPDQQVLFDVLGSLQLEVRACSMQQWIAPVERANKTGLTRHGGFRRKVPNGLVG